MSRGRPRDDVLDLFAADTRPAVPRASRPAAREPVTQAELEQYRELTETLKDLKECREGVRRELLARLSAGARVEPGLLSAEAVSVSIRTLSREKLTTLVGSEVVAGYLEQIEPTVTRRLYVRDAHDE